LNTIRYPNLLPFSHSFDCSSFAGRTRSAGVLLHAAEKRTTDSKFTEKFDCMESEENS